MYRIILQKQKLGIYSFRKQLAGSVISRADLEMKLAERRRKLGELKKAEEHLRSAKSDALSFIRLEMKEHKRFLCKYIWKLNNTKEFV